MYKKIIEKGRIRFTNFLYDAKHLLKMDSILHSASGKRILVYHGLCEQDHLRYNYSFTTKKNFEQQLQLFLRYFNIISLDEYYQPDVKTDKLSVCLTFDDGLANNYYHLLPLLQQYQVPATFFITGIRDAGYDFLWNHFLDMVSKFGPSKLVFHSENYYKHSGKYVSAITGESLNTRLRKGDFTAKESMIHAFRSIFDQAKHDHEYWMQMTNEQIKSLAAQPAVTIGCHGYYHNDLATLSPDDVITELSNNKNYLEKLCGKNITALAFPYGSYTKEVIAAAKACGFNKLLALDLLYPDDIHDKTLQPRLGVNPFISNFNQARAVTTGTYS